MCWALLLKIEHVIHTRIQMQHNKMYKSANCLIALINNKV